MNPVGILILLSPLIAIVVIVALIVHHRTKVQMKRIDKENDREALDSIVRTIDHDTEQNSAPGSSDSAEKGRQGQIIRMSCKKCGGTMDLNSNANIIFCPFCGASELITESDYIKEARIRASAEIRVAEEKRRTANELFEKYRQSIRIHHREERKDKVVKWLSITASGIIITVIGIAIIIGFFYFIVYVLPKLVL